MTECSGWPPAYSNGYETAVRTRRKRRSEALIDEARYSAGAEGVPAVQCDLLTRKMQAGGGVTLSIHPRPISIAPRWRPDGTASAIYCTLENPAILTPPELLLVGGGSRNALESN